MMKMKLTAFLAALLLASLSAAQAQTTVAAWTFDNASIGTNNSPLPSTGVGAATVLGMDNSYNNATSISFADVQSKTGSSSGAANCWRIRGGSLAGGGGSPNGWSTNAPVGTQGAQFKVSTAGYYRLQVSFDINETSAGEGNLQLEYTTDGTNWNNATITSVGTSATIMNNVSSPNTAVGSYVKLASSGTGWNNQIKADLSGIIAANNNTNFAIRIVNASTGSDCINAGGTIYNNTSGNWSIDNVVITGYAPQPVTAWTFENYSNTAAADPIIPNPAPTTGSGSASALGFDTSYTFADGNVGSVSSPDCLLQTGSSSGASGPTAWRIRGQNPGNGWFTGADIGAQGAEFDVSTYNYNTVLVTFDMYFTTQGEAKMQVEYTIDGVNWTNAAGLEYRANPTFIQTNAPADQGGSPFTVAGTYFYQTNGQSWYNNVTVDLTGVAGVTNNPNFGIRIVNAATGSDCVAFNGGSYNNYSGNWRFDNVVVSGVFAGPPAPTITPDSAATVDQPFTNTFAANPFWQYNITAITVNGAVLPSAAYNTNVSGQIVFYPSASPLLQSSGSKTILYQATSYAVDSVVQVVGAGMATKIAFRSLPAGPSGNGGTLIAQPAIAVEDQYGNGTTNPAANVVFTATAGSAGWTLGGAAVQAAVNGIASFTNLSATVNGNSAVSNAVLTFSASGLSLPATTTNAPEFVIGAPATPFTAGNLAAIQIDTVALNATFSVLELSPSITNQSAPINVVPISASTGTNSLRLSSSGSTGRLALSDDGTLLCFAGFLDGSSLTPDETYVLNRAAGTLNYTDAFTAPIQYSVTVGSSQARAASTVNNTDFVIADKNGIFIDAFNWAVDNTRAVKSFGGMLYLMSATSPKPAVYALSDSSPAATAVILPGILADTKAQDFYMVASGNNGATYDTLYILDQVSATAGVINKYSLVAGNWNVNGTFATTNGGDGLFAVNNGNGGVYLYYTTGGGGTPGNSIVRLNDAGGFNGNINITAADTIYTASAATSVKGLAAVPQATAYAAQLIPPPMLIAASGILAGSSFAVSLAPENGVWRAAITNVTVNGVSLPTAAYDVTQAGEIAFDASKSALLQSSGLKTISVSATGYGAATVVQSIGAVSNPVLGGASLNGGQLTLSFTNTTGLSFSVLATNNLTAPKTDWPVIGTAVETPAGSGAYRFTDPNPATNAIRFYQLRQP